MEKSVIMHVRVDFDYDANVISEDEAVELVKTLVVDEPYVEVQSVVVNCVDVEDIDDLHGEDDEDDEPEYIDVPVYDEKTGTVKFRGDTFVYENNHSDACAHCHFFQNSACIHVDCDDWPKVKLGMSNAYLVKVK